MFPFKFVLTAFAIIAFSITILAQDQDSLKNDKKKEFLPLKNVVRFNLTPNILGFQSAIFGYERIVAPSQSFSVNTGFIAFKPSAEGQAKADSLNAKFGLKETKNNKGFSIAADYRFYLKKENKYPAQRGIYVGPYVAAYYFDSSTELQNTDPNAVVQTVGVQTKFGVLNIGAELGYQFIIKNRLSIDLILAGPSLSRYRLRLSANGNLNVNDPEVEAALEALRDILVKKYEWLQPLFDAGELEVKGTTSLWSFGMRYVLQVGYRF